MSTWLIVALVTAPIWIAMLWLFEPVKTIKIMIAARRER